MYVERINLLEGGDCIERLCAVPGVAQEGGLQ
jgi:hypothetical protein